MKKIRYLLLAVLAGCSSDGLKDGVVGPNPPAPAAESPGGVWNGTRPNGTSIIVLISELGDMRIVDPFGNQGFGRVAITNVNEISSDYALAPPFGGSLIDGSDSGACNLAGLVQERLAINYNVQCQLSSGGSFEGTIALIYDPVYQMDSSFARIAGMYDVQGDVLTIDVNGAVFMQGTQSGCTWNGQIELLDTDWNMYGMSATSDNCQGNFSPIAGKSWDGLVTILTAEGAETLVGGITTDVDGLPVSNVLALPKF